MPEDAAPGTQPPLVPEGAATLERPRWDLLDAAAVVCLDAGALGLGAWVARDLIGIETRPTAAALAAAAVRMGIVIPALLLMAQRWWGSRPADLGLRAPEPGSVAWFLKTALALGGAYLVLGTLVGLAFYRARLVALSGGARAWLGSPEIASWLVSALLVAPIVEELVFRGVLYPALRTRTGRAAAILLSAAVFAGAHLLWSWKLFVPWTQLLGGIVFAWAYERTRSLVFPALFHLAGNLGILVLNAALAWRPAWLAWVLG
ncbi:MAG: lysostaphin resistance A-like protein [Planctomycetota bacterium]|jgi:membrane protease YdiL (CAAX protease family)